MPIWSTIRQEGTQFRWLVWGPEEQNAQTAEPPWSQRTAAPSFCRGIYLSGLLPCTGSVYIPHLILNFHIDRQYNFQIT